MPRRIDGCEHERTAARGSRAVLKGNDRNGTAGHHYIPRLVRLCHNLVVYCIGWQMMVFHLLGSARWRSEKYGP